MGLSLRYWPRWVLGGSSIPRAIRTGRSLPQALSILAATGLIYYGMRWVPLTRSPPHPPPPALEISALTLLWLTCGT